MSAREPVSWPKMPTTFTEGDLSGTAGPTSNDSAEVRWPGLARSSPQRSSPTGWSMICLMRVAHSVANLELQWIDLRIGGVQHAIHDRRHVRGVDLAGSLMTL